MPGRTASLPFWVLISALSVMLVGSPAFSKTVGVEPTRAETYKATGAAYGALAETLAQFGVITSTIRSAAHNRAVGGVANSYHLSGRAVDVSRRTGVAHWQIAAALRANGYELVESLDEGDHSHFAFTAILASSQKLRATTFAAPVLTKLLPPPEPALRADDHGKLYADALASRMEDSAQPARSSFTN